ncbi:MAG: hypothetical protein II220_02750 [Spirochaetales bacterium]|nr:hypothetical protein [Spirochaetales bacterium]
MNKVKFSSLNKAVFEQIDLPDNAVIADLGCRDAGSLLGFQQAFPNKIKTAVGVDINDKGFKNIKYKNLCRQKKQEETLKEKNRVKLQQNWAVIIQNMLCLMC